MARLQVFYKAYRRNLSNNVIGEDHDPCRGKIVHREDDNVIDEEIS